MKLAAFVLLACSCAYAQLSSSSLTGVTTPGARVTLKHGATGFAAHAKAGNGGVYRAENLLPGDYSLEVQASGFRTATIPNVRLTLGQAAQLDITLQPGDARDSITVTASVSEVDTRGAAIGYRQDAPAIRGLPLTGRNVFSLLTLGPGAIPRQLGGFGHDVVTDLEPARGAVALNPPMHGARSTMNAFILDGAINTDRNVFATAVTPPLESVLEFRAHSLLAPAEFPQAGGAVIDVVTRTGTRDFHGSAFELFRHQSLDARNFFDDPLLPRPIFHRNQFGGSIGGPLRPLRRTFFFATYEGLRDESAKSSLTLVPDQAVRGGDFSRQALIFDPNTTNSSGARLPFPDSRIPAARIDSIPRDYLNRFEPLPNRQGGTSNYLDATPSDNTNDHVSARVDHEAQRLGRFFGRYTLNAERGRSAVFPVLPAVQSVRAQQAALGWTAGGAAWLAESRIAFTRLRTFKFPENAFQTNVAAELGIQGVPDDPINYGVPFFLVPNFTLVVDDPILPQTQRDNLWQFSQDVAFNRGAHSIKLGFLGTWFQLNYQLSRQARGQYNFTGAFSSQPNSAEPAGDPFADFLLGLPQSTNRNVGATLAYLRQSTWSGYAQDEWRLSRTLTLSLGVRYEYVTPYSEARDRLLNLDYSTLPAAPALRPVDRPVDPDRNNIAPRLGFAWRTPKLPGPLGEWTFRAGYGIYFSPEIAIETYDLIRNGVRNENNSTGALTPVLTIRNGFPQTADTGLPSYFGLDRRARTPYIQQWTASLQRELARGAVLELAYVGAKGTRLGRFRQLNTPQQTEIGANLPPRPGSLQQLRAFPSLGEIIQRQHISNSSYNALEIKVEKRFISSLSLLASFVWSKSIDDADSVIQGFYESAAAQDERNLRLERGLSFFNVGRRISAGFLYRFPTPGRYRRAFGGWELSGIVTLQDGTPLNPFYFVSDFANSGTPNRPDVVPGVSVKLPRSQRTADRFFNTDAFRGPAPFTFGNAGRNIIPGPGNNLFDLAIHKRFSVAETAALDLRLEAFNAFNHPNFGIPGPYPDFGPFFGKIFSTGDPRRLQLGIRFDF